MRIYQQRRRRETPVARNASANFVLILNTRLSAVCRTYCAAVVVCLLLLTMLMCLLLLTHYCSVLRAFFFFLFQEENVKSCLPFEYTADDYAKKDVE